MSDDFYIAPEHGWRCFHCGEVFNTVDLKGFPVDSISYAENFVAGYDGEKHVTVDAEGLFSVCQAIVASARKE